MLLDEILKLLRPLLLALALVFNVVIVLHDLFTRLPVHLDNVGHELGLALKF